MFDGYDFTGQTLCLSFRIILASFPLSRWSRSWTKRKLPFLTALLFIHFWKGPIVPFSWVPIFPLSLVAILIWLIDSKHQKHSCADWLTVDCISWPSRKCLNACGKVLIVPADTIHWGFWDNGSAAASPSVTCCFPAVVILIRVVTHLGICFPSSSCSPKHLTPPKIFVQVPSQALMWSPGLMTHPCFFIYILGWFLGQQSPFVLALFSCFACDVCPAMSLLMFLFPSNWASNLISSSSSSLVKHLLWAPWLEVSFGWESNPFLISNQ